jgi:hypothetical protein
MPGVGTRVRDRQDLVVELVEPPEAGERRPGGLDERRELILRELHPVDGGDALQLIARRRLDGHDDLPERWCQSSHRIPRAGHASQHPGFSAPGSRVYSRTAARRRRHPNTTSCPKGEYVTSAG